MIYFILGIFVGIFFGFFFLKASINRSGCGELKMCRSRCPYYVKLDGVESKEKEEA